MRWTAPCTQWGEPVIVTLRGPLVLEDSTSMWAPESLRSCEMVAPWRPMSAPTCKLGHIIVSFTSYLPPDVPPAEGGGC